MKFLKQRQRLWGQSAGACSWLLLTQREGDPRTCGEARSGLELGASRFLIP